jgi:hypothetical protein
MPARGLPMFALISACATLLGTQGASGAEPAVWERARSISRWALTSVILPPTQPRGTMRPSFLAEQSPVLPSRVSHRPVAGPSQEHAVTLKTGYLGISDGGSFHVLSLIGNYQYAFLPMEGTIHPISPRASES